MDHETIISALWVTTSIVTVMVFLGVAAVAALKDGVQSKLGDEIAEKMAESADGRYEYRNDDNKFS